MHAHSLREEAVTQLVPGGEGSLAHLSDGELLLTTRRLVGIGNRLFAALLLHLAEVETRGIHRKRACASLYTYCVHELRMSEDAEPFSTAPAPRELPPITGPQHYQMQFCTTEEHVQLIERARALLARTSPGASLGELHLQAMKLSVAELEKQRFAVTATAQSARSAQSARLSEAPCQHDGGDDAADFEPVGRKGEGLVRDEPLCRKRPSGRHVPAALEREAGADT